MIQGLLQSKEFSDLRMFGEVIIFEANQLNLIVGHSNKPLLVEEESSLIIEAVYFHLS